MDSLLGCLATLSILVVTIVLLEYSKVHEKAYKFIVCEFGGFKMYYAMRVSTPSLHRDSTDSLIIIISMRNHTHKQTHHYTDSQALNGSNQMHKLSTQTKLNLDI